MIAALGAQMRGQRTRQKTPDAVATWLHGQKYVSVAPVAVSPGNSRALPEVLPWENEDEYRDLLEALVAEHKPKGRARSISLKK